MCKAQGSLINSAAVDGFFWQTETVERESIGFKTCRNGDLVSLARQDKGFLRITSYTKCARIESTTHLPPPSFETKPSVQ